VSEPGRLPPADWAEINALFHQTIEQPPDRRDAFLDDACAGRPELRAEVASLVAAHVHAEHFIEHPVADVHAALSPSPEPPRWRPGDVVGPYRIDAVLGSGGMGVVYRAEDTRLGRTVALKAVAPRFAGDELGRERLRREARAAALLHHPNIATVFALESIEGELYIASEYIEGETLRDELRRARLTPAQTIDTALEIARALEAAHDRGIVHRDLKPENVMRTAAGRIKILDFGLARLTGDAADGPRLTGDDTRLGTPAYMAPEQIRGEPVDFRADLFAFGVLLYELSTGAHPFGADHPAAIIARVLESSPPELTARRQVDPADTARWNALAAIVHTCIAKSPSHRFQASGELVQALEAARDAPPAPSGVGAFTSGHAAASPDEPALRWWQFHQALASGFYLAMLVPLNYVRHSDRDALGVALFLTGLVAALVASTLRLHLWFTRRWYPVEWIAQRQRSALWVRVADVAFVGIQFSAALLIATDRPRLAALFLGAGVAALLAFTIIEPATTRAAFRDK
jgi:serine/threonine protein kinase